MSLVMRGTIKSRLFGSDRDAGCLKTEPRLARLKSLSRGRASAKRENQKESGLVVIVALIVFGRPDKGSGH
jgi:hypothetical protein